MEGEGGGVRALSELCIFFPDPTFSNQKAASLLFAPLFLSSSGVWESSAGAERKICGWGNVDRSYHC